jgi:predicted RNA-binding protein YlqC (UPF0109 family)
MVDLLKFLITKITGSEDFEVEEKTGEDGRTVLEVKANPEIIGLIIGKAGKTIKSIRKIVTVKAVLENKSINISVIEK